MSGRCLYERAWGNAVIWGNAVVWGDTVLGYAADGTPIYGDAVDWSNVNPDSVIWGNLSEAIQMTPGSSQQQFTPVF